MQAKKLYTDRDKHLLVLVIISITHIRIIMMSIAFKLVVSSFSEIFNLSISGDANGWLQCLSGHTRTRSLTQINVNVNI